MKFIYISIWKKKKHPHTEMAAHDVLSIVVVGSKPKGPTSEMDFLVKMNVHQLTLRVVELGRTGTSSRTLTAISSQSRFVNIPQVVMKTEEICVTYERRDVSGNQKDTFQR